MFSIKVLLARSFQLLLAFSCILHSSSVSAQSISSSIANIAQCQYMSVTWSGGRGPWTLEFLPDPNTYAPSAGVLVYTIPVGAVQPYKALMPWSSGARGIYAIVDQSTGYSGVANSYFTVASSSTTTCLDSNAANENDFYFSISDPSPVQCQSITLSWTSNFTHPATIYSYTIGGAVSQVYQTVGPQDTSESVRINYPSGQQFVLAMFDGGKYGNGGNSAAITVGSSNDASCLSVSTTTTTPSSTTPYSTTTPGSTTPYSTPANSIYSPVSTTSVQPGPVPSNQLNVGAVAGGTVAGTSALAILVISLLCFRRRARRRKNVAEREAGRNFAMGFMSPEEEKLDPNSFGSARTPYEDPDPLNYGSASADQTNKETLSSS